MLIDFFIKLRDYKVPVSLNEFLIFLEALGKWEPSAQKEVIDHVICLMS